MGSYYTYDTHQVFGGFGAAPSFDADQVWADAEEGGKYSVYQQAKQGCLSQPGADTSLCAHFDKQIANANFRGNRAANAVRGGLRHLGYEPGMDDTVWGGADKAAWSKFAADNNVPAGPGLVSKSGVYKMGELIHGGGAATAGIGPLGWALLLLAGAAGTVALVSGRKKKGKTPTGRAQIALRR
jgi:hypothetical protein